MDLASHTEKETLAKQGQIERAKILCMVYTYEANHYKVPTILETWANKCDGKCSLLILYFLLLFVTVKTSLRNCSIYVHTAK